MGKRKRRWKIKEKLYRHNGDPLQKDDILYRIQPIGEYSHDYKFVRVSQTTPGNGPLVTELDFEQIEDTRDYVNDGDEIMVEPCPPPTDKEPKTYRLLSDGRESETHKRKFRFKHYHEDKELVAFYHCKDVG